MMKGSLFRWKRPKGVMKLFSKFENQCFAQVKAISFSGKCFDEATVVNADAH